MNCPPILNLQSRTALREPSCRRQITHLAFSRASANIAFLANRGASQKVSTVSFLTVPDAARLLYEEAQSHERGNYDDRSHSRPRCRRGAVYRRNAEAAVASFARKLVPVEVRVPDDLDTAFQVWARERVDLGLILPDGMFLRRQLIATLATAARLSTLCGFREHVEDGGLMSGSPPVRVGGAARPMSIRCSERSQTRRSASGIAYKIRQSSMRTGRFYLTSRKMVANMPATGSNKVTTGSAWNRQLISGYIIRI
jgi:hypothetical protein